MILSPIRVSKPQSEQIMEERTKDKGQRKKEKGKGKRALCHWVTWRSGSTRSLFPVSCFLFPFFLLGCAAGRSHLDQALRADQGDPVRNESVAEQYAVACPDVLELAVAGRPDLNG